MQKNIFLSIFVYRREFFGSLERESIFFSKAHTNEVRERERDSYTNIASFFLLLHIWFVYSGFFLLHHSLIIPSLHANYSNASFVCTLSSVFRLCVSPSLPILSVFGSLSFSILSLSYLSISPMLRHSVFFLCISPSLQLSVSLTLCRSLSI